MYGTRVTFRSLTEGAMTNLQKSLQTSQRLSEQLTSGRRIYRPSDDATGSVSALQHRTTQRAVQQHVRNAQDGMGWLQTADSALQSAITNLREAYTKTIQAANDSSGQLARNAIANDIEGIRDNITTLANSKFADRPVFGGTNASEVAFNATTGAWEGNATAVNRQVNETTKVQVNTNGEKAFSASASIDGQAATTETYFAILSDAAQQMRNGNTAGIQTAISNLQALEDSLKTALTGVGSRYQRIEAAINTGNDKELNYQSRIAEIESIDLPKTIMEVQMQEVAYRAALGATAKAMQPSLMDFLR